MRLQPIINPSLIKWRRDIDFCIGNLEFDQELDGTLVYLLAWWASEYFLADPFGHAASQASLFAQMGFDAFFFARIDYSGPLFHESLIVTSEQNTYGEMQLQIWNLFGGEATH